MAVQIGFPRWDTIRRMCGRGEWRASAAAGRWLSGVPGRVQFFCARTVIAGAAVATGPGTRLVVEALTTLPGSHRHRPPSKTALQRAPRSASADQSQLDQLPHTPLPWT